MKLPLVFTFVAGLAAGCAVTILLLPEVGPASAELKSSTRDRSPTGSDDELLRLRIDLREKDAALATARSKLISTQNELVALRAAAAEENAEQESEEAAREARRQEREEAFVRRMKELADRELEEILRVADLTPAQASAIQHLLADRNARRLAAIAARRDGTDAPVYDGPSFRDSLAAILSPAQLEAYENYEDTVRIARIETGATAQMNRIAPALSLTEDQKDQVYALYYNGLAERMSSDDADSASDENAPQASLSAQMQQILSPEQFAEWEEISARQNQSRGRGRFRGGPPSFGP